MSHKLTLLCLLCLVSVGRTPVGAQGEATQEQIDMAAMMKRAQAITSPTENHALLDRFLGSWTTETRFTLAGLPETPEKGTSTISWLIDERWIKMEGKGTLMGMPHHNFVVLGYDNFKHSYRMMSVGNTDTAMLTSEGDLDPGGKALILYGTLDEYLTGEHDKMVKYVWRFVSEDRMLLEVHDLPIGEKNTQVIEIAFNRKK